MAFGALFTSSDIGGGRPFTRIKGQLLLGYPSGDPGGHTMEADASNGGAGRPLLSFYNRPDSGWFLNSASSSAGEIRLSMLGVSKYSMGSTAFGPIMSTGFMSTTPAGPFIGIPQSTGPLTSTAGNTAPAPLTPMAYLNIDTANSTIEVYSTVWGTWKRFHDASNALITLSSS